MTAPPRYFVNLRSTNVQVYPAMSHACGDCEREFVGVTGRMAWFEQIGDYLCWSCPHCEIVIMLSVDRLSKNTGNTKIEDGGSGALVTMPPVLMGLNEWLRRTNTTLTREEFCRAVKEAQ